MIYPKVTIGEIQTRDLLYYDPDLNDVCFRFCQDRNIDCLPSLFDQKIFFRWEETGFYEDKITAERSLDENEFIFDSSLLERFRANHLLFVHQNKALTGVIHFSDYNRPIVSTYLFNLLTAFEKSLRRLLVQAGLKNKQMLEYFQRVSETAKKTERKDIYAGKLNEYEKHRDRNEKLPAFEGFYLKDLIELAKEHKIVCVREEVNTLRNMIMHANELVNLDDVNRDDYIYDFTSFEKFFKQAETLVQDYKKVNNRIAFMAGVER